MIGRKVGASQNQIDARLETISAQAVHTQARFENLKDMEKSVIELNQSILGYEAIMLLVSKTQNLSLHKYL